MNKKYLIGAVLIILLISLAGCSTTKPVVYSFADEESENGTATITFAGNKKNGVLLIHFEGNRLPAPEKGKRWEPITLPAGRQLNLRVNVFNDDNYSSSGYAILDMFMGPIIIGNKTDKNVTFECPALEAGKNYKLTFRNPAIGRSSLILTDINSGVRIYEQKL